MRSTRRAALTLAGALGVLAVASPAAAEQPAPSTVGYDVSYPQCDTELPDDAAYAVIGVNGGIATTENPCLAEQWEWAHDSSGAEPAQPRAQLYVNTANPGEVRQQVSTWPRSGATRYGVCDGDNSAACSYEYGVDRAEDDVEMVLDTLGDLPGDAAVTEDDLEGLRWWLDVETMNTWQTDGAAAQRNNRATLEGMTDHLESVGGRVGLYSTGYQWGEIVGDVPAWSSLHGLDSWLAGARSLPGAIANCADAPLVDGGRVVLTQYVEDDLDHNHSCVESVRWPGSAPSGPRG
ncbi:hypothetical protein GCM10023328_20740 [Modestobacter marinus]|uniref:Uncharacterized protein n=1 Tax=Modestobacter marinus TaxID=477641 RepID=A0A846LQ88_9ACTN|nr:hypothetical protein [Modestobacter marinus]NIH65659.1 hypothetical protein [Modestobacter marinus]GGL66111.1 hypothetical protein GCM10011589_22950 [Modestobacter marinus]